MIRSTLLVLALALAFHPGPAFAGRDVLREQSARTVDTAGLRGVRVENPRGDVRAAESSDGRIHVTALKLVRSGSRRESERMAGDLHVDVATESGQLVVRARYPARRSIRIGVFDLFHDLEWPTEQIDLAIQIPAGLPLTVRTSSGDVETAGLTGMQQIESASGRVHVEQAGSDVEIATSSGDVDASDLARARVRTSSGAVEIASIRGPLNAHTTSGDLTVRDASDSLLLGTVSGDVEVLRAPRGFSATTTNGDVKAHRVGGRIDLGTSSGAVDLGLVAPLAGARVSTGSGDIELRFDRGMAARLDLQTSNGQLEMESPIQVQSLTRRHVTGQLRQGGAAVSLRSASGDIHVMTGEQGS